MISGTPKNKHVIDEFKKIISNIESGSEHFALQVYRNMFREDPTLFKVFPFCKNEWTRIASADYNGVYPEQPVNSWFIIFR